ncbi:helix-turn-helix transcriptional regulator [bacterium]|nr:helix-turn-helix transcriptional regulator [bacterium]
MTYNEKETMKKFGENVKRYCTSMGITQEKLAELCDCSPQTISGTETGYSFPSSKVLFKIAKNLNIPLMFLFNFGEDSEISNKAENFLILKSLSKMSIEKKKIAIKIIKAIDEVV